MPQLSREDVENVLAKFSQCQIDLAREDFSKVGIPERAERTGKLLVFMISLVSGVTLWSGTMQWESSRQKIEIEKLDRYCEKDRENRFFDQTVIQSIQNTIVANRDERVSRLTALQLQIDDLNIRKKQHDIMWGMKENGRSNKEEYLRINRVAAPDLLEK